MFRLPNGLQLPASSDCVPESLDLDSVFNRLQVNPESVCTQNFTTIPVTPNEELQRTVAKKLKETRRKERGKKCIIRKANLVLPKPLNKYTKEKEDAVDTNDNTYCDTGPSTDSSPAVGVSNCQVANCPPDAGVSCGAQHTQQTHRQLTNDESNADELASYFEQMLVIPKPMSLMAEMMYA